MRGCVDDVLTDDFSDHGPGDEGVEQIEPHGNPGGLERVERPLPPPYGFEEANRERQVHRPQHVREHRIHVCHRLLQERRVMAQCHPDHPLGELLDAEQKRNHGEGLLGSRFRVFERRHSDRGQ